MALSNLASRLLTALVASPLILLLLFRGPQLGWYALVLAGSLIAASEVLAMTHPGDRSSQLVGTLLTALLSLAFYFTDVDARLLPSALMLSTMIGLLLPLCRVGDMATAAGRITGLIAAPAYVGLLLCPIALLRRDAGADGPGFVLMTLMFAWLADTGGYLAGRLFGKHKLAPVISPKKTWEGLAGALLGAVLGGCLAHFWYLPSIPLQHVLPLALVAGALGQLGDLAESLIKRSANIKDSGWVIPGHGGLLDRVDGLLLAGPAVYLYLLWR